MDEGARLTRRQSLAKAGGLAALLTAGGWKLAGEGDADAAVGPAAVASGAVACVLAPEQTEGPYYVSGAKVRRTITEGRPGVSLTLRLRVVDASSCKPIRNAAVDVWHADALGNYSGVGAQVGKTFMRGVQKTDANGLALFRTVYPGWYQGLDRAHPRDGAHRRQRRAYRPALLSDMVTDAVYKVRPTAGGRAATSATPPMPSTGTAAAARSSCSSGRRRGSYVGAITMGVHRS